LDEDVHRLEKARELFLIKASNVPRKGVTLCGRTLTLLGDVMEHLMDVVLDQA